MKCDLFLKLSERGVRRMLSKLEFMGLVMGTRRGRLILYEYAEYRAS
ncbi:MAG: hypothetical protein ACUVQ0_05915 [Thermoproteota archaeon]